MTIRRISPKRSKTAKLRYNSTFGTKAPAKAVMSIEELKASGLLKLASKIKRKPTGEAKVFRAIWEEREHRCEVCRIVIAEAKASNFSHLLPKGSYPSMRLDPRNIRIKCWKCHDLWHRHTAEGLRFSHGWGPVVAMYDDLKAEYNQRTRRA